MRTEEELLFPEIKKLSKMKNNRETDRRSHCGDVKKLIINLQEKHLQAIERLMQIRKIASGYIEPSNISSSFKNLYKRIKKYEDDFSVHVYLENNILFQKTLALTEILAGEDEKGLVVT